MNNSENELYNAIELMIENKINSMNLFEYQIGTVMDSDNNGDVICKVCGRSYRCQTCDINLQCGDFVVVLMAKKKRIIIGKVNSL